MVVGNDPGNEPNFLFESIASLSSAIHRREVSVAEVVGAYLTRIERLNPALNAIVVRDDERARRRAHAADVALAHGENWGPLHGVPFTLKDAHATAGLRTTSGYPQLADYRG